MSWVLGVDSSTSGTKALIADERGRVVAQGQASHPLESVSEGGWEQDPTTWKSSFIGAVRAACEGLSPEERARIRRLAIAHQRETFVCTNERGEPLAPAIVWMDERASREVAEVRGAASERWVHEVSGKPVGLTPSLPKIRMLLRRLRPELRPSYVLDVHGFLAFWLTGAPSTSIASADPMGVVDLASGRYEDELIALSGAPREAFPRLVHVGEDLGLLTDDALASLGLGGPISLIAGAGDGQAAILGAGVIEPGRAVLNVGTALVCGTPIAKYRTTRAARTLKSASGEGFILETDLKGGTLSLDWLLSIVGADAREGRASRSRALGELASEAVGLPDEAAPLLFVPYLAGVMNPHWDDSARGIWVGLSAHHRPAHLYRSIVYGLGFELRLSLARLEEEVGPLDVTLVGGPTQNPAFRKLFVDALGRSARFCPELEGSALGAVSIALGAGRLEASPPIASWAHPSGEVPGFEAYARLYDAVAPLFRRS